MKTTMKLLCVVVVLMLNGTSWASPLLPGDVVWLDGESPLNTRIVKIDPITGEQSVFASGGLLADGSSTDLAFDANGDLLVAQGVNRRVLRIDRETGEQAIVSAGGLLSEGGGFFGIAVEPDGNILRLRFFVGHHSDKSRLRGARALFEHRWHPWYRDRWR